MKAIRSARTRAATAFSFPLPMLALPLLALPVLAAACSAPQAAAPAAAPVTRPAVQSLAPAPPHPTALDWRDAPITPGDWTWSMEGNRSVARFAGGLLTLACDRAAGMVTLYRQGTGEGLPGGEVPMTIVTSNMTRPLAGSASPGPPPAIAATFRARDSLLDAMAFSRGRFVVETAGLPALFAPSWPEVSRVVEDCR